MNPYHKWLLRQRRYCEHRGCLMQPATKVINVNGKDYCFCDWHGVGQIERGLRRRYEKEMEARQ